MVGNSTILNELVPLLMSHSSVVLYKLLVIVCGVSLVIICSELSEFFCYSIISALGHMHGMMQVVRTEEILCKGT